MAAAQIPQSPDAERDLIGAMLLSPDAIRAAGGVEGDDFHDPRLQAVFAAVMTLHHRGAAVDVTTVAEELTRAGLAEQVGGPTALRRIQAATPASANAVHYAEIVAQGGALRRAIMVADQIRSAAVARDLDAVEALIADAPERVSAPLGLVEPGDDLATLIDESVERPPARWIIPQTMVAQDRLMLTGAEGAGKSTLLRQLAVQAAIGVHPWNMTEMPRVRVLHLDMENSREQSEDEYRKIATPAVRAKYEPGWLAVKRRPQGMNLAKRADFRWLEALLAAHRPQLLCIGPLYQMMQGTERQSVHSEEIASEVKDRLNELRVRYDVAMIIEAHSPHADPKSRKRDLRPIGSSVWLRWTEFGYGISLNDDGTAKFSRWRWDRVRGRRWPSTLQQGPSFPWQAPEIF